MLEPLATSPSNNFFPSLSNHIFQLLQQQPSITPIAIAENVADYVNTRIPNLSEPVRIKLNQDIKKICESNPIFNEIKQCLRKGLLDIVHCLCFCASWLLSFPAAIAISAMGHGLSGVMMVITHFFVERLTDFLVAITPNDPSKERRIIKAVADAVCSVSTPTSTPIAASKAPVGIRKLDIQPGDVLASAQFFSYARIHAKTSSIISRRSHPGVATGHIMVCYGKTYFGEPLIAHMIASTSTELSGWDTSLHRRSLEGFLEGKNQGAGLIVYRHKNPLVAQLIAYTASGNHEGDPRPMFSGAKAETSTFPTLLPDTDKVTSSAFCAEYVIKILQQAHALPKDSISPQSTPAYFEAKLFHDPDWQYMVCPGIDGKAFDSINQALDKALPNISAQAAEKVTRQRDEVLQDLARPENARLTDFDKAQKLLDATWPTLRTTSTSKDVQRAAHKRYILTSELPSISKNQRGL